MALWFVLCLPAFLAALAVLAEAGRAFAAKAVLAGVADAASLAGALELDLDRLAEGERRLDPERARRWAEEVAHANLDESFPGLPRRVRVEVLNASGDEPLIHPVTGRRLEDPTVFVQVGVRLPFAIPWGSMPVWLGGRADASVLPRRY